MYELRVGGMTCGGCASRVTKAVQSLDVTAKVNVDLQSKSVYVDTRIPVVSVQSIITDAGYPATVKNTD